MINNKKIESILIVIIVILGYFKATGDVTYGGDPCSEDYMTGPFCNISCKKHDTDSNEYCRVLHERCSLDNNGSLSCQCVGLQNVSCIFEGCSENCNHGYCYRRKDAEDDVYQKCFCEEGYGGILCEQLKSFTATTLQPMIQTTSNGKTTSVSQPLFIELVPEYGPYAGVTKVVITVENFGEFDNISLHEAVEIQLRNDNSLTILTPPFYASENISLQYYLNGQTSEKKDTGLYFEYRPNPTVSDIYPKKAIISGGTYVTVTGTNFKSVASPQFKVYIRNRTNDDNAPLIEILKKTCKHKNETQLLCRFPNITSELEKQHSRRKRFVRKANDLLLRKIREAPTIDQLQFTLGLEFDGADHYEDLADSNPRLGFIDVHPDPKFHTYQEILFDPAVAKVIGIKGEDIDSGTVIEDYKVYIGDVMCTDIGLTFDKLYCSPPENIDDIKDRGSERRPNEANVTVHIGINLRHYVGFITYNTEDPTVPLYTLFIPVVAAIGGVVLILFIILIVCACRNSDAKDEPLTAPSVTDIDNMAPTGNDNYYTGQTAPKDQYYMVVNKDDRRKGSLPPPDKSAVDGRI